MNKSSTRETPFRLTYGMEAIDPTEVRVPLRRSLMVVTTLNDELLKDIVIFLDEL